MALLWAKNARPPARSSGRATLVGSALLSALGACSSSTPATSPWTMPERPVASAAATPAGSNASAGASRAPVPAWWEDPGGSNSAAPDPSVGLEPTERLRSGAEIDGLWWTDDQAAFAEARPDSRGVVIDFWASWCPPCHLLDSQTFQDAQVRVELATFFVPVRLDMTEQDERNRQRLLHYQVYSLPAVLMFDGEGRELDRIGTFVGADELLARQQVARAKMHR